MPQIQSRSLVALSLALAILAAKPAICQETSESAVLHAKALSQAFRQAADAARPSVVTVLVRTKSSEGLRQLLPDDQIKQLFPDHDEDSNPQEDLLMHVGSGIVVDASGIILTNNHVVAEAEQVTVRLADGQEYVATGTVTDPMSDLAIVRIQANVPLVAARFGDSDQTSIGDWVIAIGSPFELETTVSAGIISAKGRGIDKIKRGRLLQTDAAINPGNSGGPLVNLDGEVVGVSTAIATSYGGYQGVGFAIPANRAKWVWKELADHGNVRRASLGIGIAELNAMDAVKFSTTARAGVWVQRVDAKGAAAHAGLRENDLIVEFAGTPVHMPRDLQDVVEQTPIGSKVPVKVRRGSDVIELEVLMQALTK